MIDLLLALVLLALATAIAGYLLWLLAVAVLPSLVGGIERARLRRCEARAAAGDRYLAAGQLRDAVGALGEAVYRYPTSDPRTADAVRRHHAGLMSRVIALADHIQNGQVRLMSVAKLDRLMEERNQLQWRYVAALHRGGPADRREARRALRRNAAEMRRAMHQLAEELSSHADRGMVH